MLFNSVIIQFFFKKSVSKTICFIVISFCVFKSGVSLYKSFTINQSVAGTDLRNHVVAIRLLSTHHPKVYFYKWKQGDKEQFCDPNDKPERILNGITITPGQIIFLSWYNFFSYKKIRLFWWVFEQVLLLSTGIYFIASANGAYNRLLLIVCFTMFFLTSQSWLLHIDRGQTYIIYAFVFFLIFLLSRNATLTKNTYFFIGMLLVLSAFIRPFFIILSLPLFAINGTKLFKGVALSVILLLGLTIFTHGFVYWQEYFTAMKQYSLELNDKKIQQHNDTVCHYPPIIEKQPIGYYRAAPGYNTAGLSPIARYMHNFKLNPPTWVYTALLACFSVPFTLLMRYKRSSISTNQLIVAYFILYIVAELLSPTPRMQYNLIQWLVPALILLGDKKKYFGLKIAVIVGLCLNNDIFISPKYQTGAGELLLLLASIVYVFYDALKSIPHTAYAGIPKPNANR